MKRFVFRSIVMVAICSAAAVYLIAQQLPEPPLTNAAVVKLVRAGFKEKTVIAIIHNRPSRFTLSPDKLIELKRSGVSENIILAMLAQDESFVFSEDDWNDDSTFGGRRRAGESDQRERSGGAEIFGGSQGSRSQSGGRGTNGGNEAETTTTGSATVRILRPPSESGETTVKLERTPTLNNDSVVKLVEAGFSEGTIIKRIEDSPADFDLSNPRLEELRRRRVSEAIIAAMSAAMSDEPNPKQIPPSRTKGN
jgi:hypothetical protein